MTELLDIRLKLDRRIHAQRKALRDNWEIVDRRQKGHRRFTLEIIREAARLCDLLGVPSGSGGSSRYPLLHRMRLAAQGIETRRATLPDAVAGERERCARIAEEMPTHWTLTGDNLKSRIAAAIRKEPS